MSADLLSALLFLVYRGRSLLSQTVESLESNQTVNKRKKSVKSVKCGFDLVFFDILLLMLCHRPQFQLKTKLQFRGKRQVSDREAFSALVESLVQMTQCVP